MLPQLLRKEEDRINCKLYQLKRFLSAVKAVFEYCNRYFSFFFIDITLILMSQHYSILSLCIKSSSFGLQSSYSVYVSLVYHMTHYGFVSSKHFYYILVLLLIISGNSNFPVVVFYHNLIFKSASFHFFVLKYVILFFNPFLHLLSP